VSVGGTLDCAHGGGSAIWLRTGFRAGTKLNVSHGLIR
jgi:hypothetical protein